MPYPPDSDTTDPNDAPRRSATGSSPVPDDRSPGWARRARTGSAVTAVAALAALGGGTVAHAAPAQTAQVSAAPLLAGQTTAKTPVHTVSPGDSLWALAQRHGVAVDELMRWNDLSGAALLMPGQKLRLSGGAAPAAESSEKAAPPAEDPPRTDHVVRSGDSLWSISQKHGVPVQALLDDNDLTVNSLLRPGQRLSVAAPAPAAVRTATTPEPRPEQERAVGDTFLGRTYEDGVVVSANRHHEQLSSRPAPSREEMRRLVHETAVRMGVDPALALAHAYQESGFDHRAVSPADAVGTMQVIPDAGDWASGLVGRELDLLDPQDNVTAGVAIIRQLGRAAPSTDVAIAAYYQGLHGVKKYGMYDDTKQYVKNVKSHRKRFGP
ncbi:LysM peptidoglycan-binding domain-containing protein [uncultured Kocuria sp.]|uniref:LysM peptidoglycan-binding domain-containing protein n=1 Tax=uncultured Kocuria sp. TaxID=259305 RepID=UPI00262D8492|nr:LysM peptidoglycan-binding domain-containing protein [uncultured Kocuria sp.]